MSTRYPNGLFTWTDLSTPDPDAARAFYGGLFGWDAEERPAGEWGTYTMCSKDGKYVAGMAAPAPGSEAPPMWTSYVTVDDIDAVTETARSLGGTVVMQPMAVFEAGRMAMIQDPTGGALALWEPGKHAGAGIFNVPGAMCWNELATRDQDGARAFYTELLGWDTEEMEMEGGQGTYVIVKAAGRMNGGILQMTEEWPDEVPAHWMVYFNVADADAAAARVKELGGGIEFGPMDMQVGRFFLASDPQGARFTCIQLQQADPYP